MICKKCGYNAGWIKEGNLKFCPECGEKYVDKNETINNEVVKSHYCPRCNQKLEYFGSDKYLCNSRGCPVSFLYKEELEIMPNKKIILGKCKNIGKITFSINTNTGLCGFRLESMFNGYYHGHYHLSDLIINIETENQLVYKSSGGVAPMIVGGVLFGSGGAIAGSLTSNKKEKVVNDKVYLLTITTKDINFTGFQVEIKDYNVIHHFINTVDYVRKHLFREKEEKIIIEDNKEFNDISEEVAFEKLLKIKKLFEEGIIDEEEYKEKRRKYLEYI